MVLCSCGQLPALTALHHAAVYQQRVTGLLEAAVCPVLQMLKNARLQHLVQVCACLASLKCVVGVSLRHKTLSSFCSASR